MSAQILILDDDIEFRDFLSTTLMAMGHEVYPAGRYEQALSILRNIPFDLLIVDGHLPDGNGVDFIANVRQHDTTTRIIFLSAFTTYFQEESTKDMLLNTLGVSKMLKKPIDSETFLKSIEQVLQSPSPVMGKPETIAITDSSVPHIDEETVAKITGHDTVSFTSNANLEAFSGFLSTPSVTDSAVGQDALPSSLENRLAEVKKAGVETIRERLTQLHDIIDSFHKLPTLEKITEGHAIAHKVHGSAGTYGFPKVSQSAAQMELILYELLNGASYHPLVLSTLEQLLDEAFSNLIVAPQPLWTAPQSANTEDAFLTPAPSTTETSVSLLKTPEGLHGKLLFFTLSPKQKDIVRQVCIPYEFEALFAETPEELETLISEQHFDAFFLHLYTGENEDKPVAEPIQEYLSKSMYVIPRSVKIAHNLRKAYPKSPIIFFSEHALLEDRILAANTSDLFIKESAFGLELVRLLQTLVTQAKNKARILLVDGNKEASATLQTALLKENYNVQVMHTHENILERLSEFEPDLVMLEFTLPKINGLDLCKVLRAVPKWRNLPIFIYAEEALSTLPRASLEAGADEFISKRELPKQIAQRIRKRLRLL